MGWRVVFKIKINVILRVFRFGMYLVHALRPHLESVILAGLVGKRIIEDYVFYAVTANNLAYPVFSAYLSPRHIKLGGVDSGFEYQGIVLGRGSVQVYMPKTHLRRIHFHHFRLAVRLKYRLSVLVKKLDLALIPAVKALGVGNPADQKALGFHRPFKRPGSGADMVIVKV